MIGRPFRRALTGWRADAVLDPVLTIYEDLMTGWLDWHFSGMLRRGSFRLILICRMVFRKQMPRG